MKNELLKKLAVSLLISLGVFASTTTVAFAEDEDEEEATEETVTVTGGVRPEEQPQSPAGQPVVEQPKVAPVILEPIYNQVIILAPEKNTVEKEMEITPPLSPTLVWVNSEGVYYYLSRMDRLTKRLGSLDDYRFADDKNNGLWLRTEQSKHHTDKARFYQLGYNYSSILENERQWLNGVSLNYLKGAGRSKAKGISLHSTLLDYKKHYYLDLLLHWGRYQTEAGLISNNTSSSFTHKGSLYKLSLEAGYDKKWRNGWFLRPQGQLQFAHTGGKNYTLSDKSAFNISGANSLVGRLGFELGKNFKQNHRAFLFGNIYREFLSSSAAKVNTNSATLIAHNTVQLPRNWYALGVGYSYKGKRFTPYINAERLFYSNYGNSTQVNAGISYNF